VIAVAAENDAGAAERIAAVRKKISLACARAGRNVSEITLLPVSKGRSVAQIAEMSKLGFNSFGENYARELLEKSKTLAAQNIFPEWHFLGHLQSNKASKIAAAASMVQSVDSESLAGKISSAASSNAQIRDVLAEVNIAGEEQKFGVHPDETIALCKKISALSGVRLRGLMCMAPFGGAETARRHFANMRVLFEKTKRELAPDSFNVLSMGMSNDFEIAVEEGSTLVRIGRALFE